VSDELKTLSTDARKGCCISTTDKVGRVFLPPMNAIGFSQFSFLLLQGDGDVSLSLK